MHFAKFPILKLCSSPNFRLIHPNFIHGIIMGSKRSAADHTNVQMAKTEDGEAVNLLVEKMISP